MRKFNLFIALFLGYVGLLTAQYSEIKISEDIYLTKLSENVYIHTSNGNNNGIIYKVKNEAIIVSTPENGELTKELIEWVKNSLKVKIIAYVLDRWHPDAMGGINTVHEYGIPTYAFELTREITKQKGLTVPQNGFDTKLELKIGDKNVVCHYFGPAHTDDGIVVWIPDEQILFGGNEIRNYNGWFGNIADANIYAWSETIEKVKAEYGSAKIVVPGHGKYGGPELIDYTINLYKPSKWGAILKKHDIKPDKAFNDYGDIFTIAENDSVVNNKIYLINSIVFVDNDDQYVMIESPLIIYRSKEKSIFSEVGRIKILNKSSESIKDEVDGYYKRLVLELRENEVEIVIILKEMYR